MRALRCRSWSARTDFDAEADRSRAGTGPISSRSSTDLDAEPDRSRRPHLAVYLWRLSRFGRPREPRGDAARAVRSAALWRRWVQLRAVWSSCRCPARLFETAVRHVVPNVLLSAALGRAPAKGDAKGAVWRRSGLSRCMKAA